ncbi:hypothetical protein J6590_094024 [Homalodisca vitripennis]|nr:hypothetical protein J6590_094024 [Homalodisca vitripennis]
MLKHGRTALRAPVEAVASDSARDHCKRQMIMMVPVDREIIKTKSTCLDSCDGFLCQSRTLSSCRGSKYDLGKIGRCCTSTVLQTKYGGSTEQRGAPNRECLTNCHQAARSRGGRGYCKQLLKHNEGLPGTMATRVQRTLEGYAAKAQGSNFYLAQTVIFFEDAEYYDANHNNFLCTRLKYQLEIAMGQLTRHQSSENLTYGILTLPM